MAIILSGELSLAKLRDEASSSRFAGVCKFGQT
jgi:hypothetical protein